MFETPPLAHGTASSDVAASPTLRAAGNNLFAGGEFVAGTENRLVIAAVGELMHSRRLAPLVFFGASGVGKSAAVRDFTTAWKTTRCEDIVVALAGSEFAEQYAAAVDEDCIERFRRRLHDCDLLIVDGLQQMSAKEAAQWELVHALDALEARDAAVVVTLDVAPARAEWMIAGLSARLAGGAVVNVTPPAVESTREILERLARRTGVPVDAEVFELLAADRSRNAAELGGLLLSLCRNVEATGRRLTLDVVDAALNRREGKNTPTIKRVAEVTARRFKLTVADLKSPSRRRTIVAARDAAMFTARRLTGRTLCEIGDYFGKRDHTTVMHGCRKLEAAVERDSETRLMLEELGRAVLE